MTKVVRVSEAQVVSNIVEILRLKPKLKKDLPAGCEKREFWGRLLSRTPAMRRMLDVLREMPAFNERLPKRRTAAGWDALLNEGFGNVIEQILRDIVKRANKKPPHRPPLRRWRDAYGPREKIQRIRPKESDAWLPNPHRGTTTFQRFQGDPLYACWQWSDTHGPTTFKPAARETGENLKYIPRTTLSYCRWPWSWLEPRKGRYRWDIVDGALAAAQSHGQTLQVRFEPYTSRVNYAETPCTAKRHPPEKSVNVPDWYWDTGARWLPKGPYAPHEPDSNDPRYAKHFGDFIRAFAKRYDGHPALESVDMAYAGFWGESGGNSTRATAARLVDIYLRSFKRTQLLSMLGTPGCTYAARRVAGKGQRAGWRADCFGDLREPNVRDVPLGQCWNHTFHYPREITRCGVKNAWQSAPVTMETCWNVPGWYMDSYDLDVVVREGYRYHTSVFMPKSAFFPAATLDKMIEFDKRIGYRFVLRQLALPLDAQRGRQIAAEFFVDNVGCAPIYRPYRLALRFRQRGGSAIVPLAQDIRKWMPGHTWFAARVAVPRTLKRGEAKVDLAIIGDDGNPRVWFAIQGEQVDGWHALTSVDLT